VKNPVETILISCNKESENEIGLKETVLDGFFDGCEMRLTHDEDFVNTSYS
jgi:hypothetical protein